MRLVAAVIMLLTCESRCLDAQASEVDSVDRYREYFTFHDDPPLSCLLTYFPPFFVQHGIELKSFIRSKTFRRIREKFGDARASDALYVRSMQLTDNNTAIALLLSTIATFDHRVVGLKIPVFELFFPLSNESQPEFDRRVTNLPRRLYSDTPETPAGDRDKLQHFFGSAFLTLVFESNQGAERFGYFVEEGEDAFIVGGVMDDRDLRSDRDGARFGTALLLNNRRLPSEFLGIDTTAEGVSPAVTPSCVGVW